VQRRDCTTDALGISLPCARLIKEFEREARTDGVPPADLATRKKALVQELNGFIGMKKERSADLEARRELTASSSQSGLPEKLKGGVWPSISPACSHHATDFIAPARDVVHAAYIIIC
jgi:hypothetical protein